MNRRQTLLAVLLTLVSLPSALANPMGGQVVAGQATFQRSGANLTVKQQTDRAIVNWQDFSIGSGETTTFLQPSSASAVLNRVVSGNPSALLGTLNANGQVYLINPNGVLVGKDGVINTQSFIASTLSLGNSDFMAGGDLTFAGDSTAPINVDGAINVAGDVYLIAGSVNLTGDITAGGEAGLAGGHDVVLKASGDDRLAVRVTSQDGHINQLGKIEAATIALRTAGNNPYALAINHQGISRATGAANINGQIILVANGGTAQVNGVLDASTNAVGRNGGFIETSGAAVHVADTARIDTSSAHGATGTWLLDPNDFTIAASGGDITGTALSSQLANNNVSIDTATQGTSGGNGDVFVNDNVSWASGNSLTLTAQRNITVNSSITNTGAGNITLNTGDGIAGSAGANAVTAGANGENGVNGTDGGNILVNAAITTATGNISLNTGNGGAGGHGGDALDPGNESTIAPGMGGAGGAGGAGGSITLNAMLATGGTLDLTTGTGGTGGQAGVSGQGTKAYNGAGAPGAPGGDGGQGGGVTDNTDLLGTIAAGSFTSAAIRLGDGGTGGVGGQGGKGRIPDFIDFTGNSGGVGGSGGTGGDAGALTSNASDMNTTVTASISFGTGGTGGNGGDGGQTLQDCNWNGCTGNVGAAGGVGGNGGAGSGFSLTSSIALGASLHLPTGNGGTGGIGGMGGQGAGSSVMNPGFTGPQGYGATGGSGGAGGTGGGAGEFSAVGLTTNSGDIVIDLGTPGNGGIGGPGGPGGGGLVGYGATGPGGSVGGVGLYRVSVGTLDAQGNIIINTAAGPGGGSTVSISDDGANLALIARTGSLDIGSAYDILAGSHSVTINVAAGDIAPRSIQGSDLSLVTSGLNGAVGTSVTPIVLNASGTLFASADNGNGGIFLDETGDILLKNTWDAGTGAIAISASGSLSADPSSLSLIGSAVTLSAGSSLVINNGGVNVGTGTITLDSGGSLQMDGVALTASAVNLSAGSSLVINNGGVNVGTGTITLDSGGSLQMDGVALTASAVTLTSSASIIVGAGGIDAGHSTITLNSGNSSSNDIQINGAISAGSIIGVAGNGGAGYTWNYDGGRGGDVIINASLTALTGGISLTAGQGGVGYSTEFIEGNGGRGGDIQINAALNAATDIQLLAGDGASGGTSSGGTVFTADSGSAAIPGQSGRGGNITIGSSITSDAGKIAISAGNGADGSHGGDGLIVMHPHFLQNGSNGANGAAGGNVTVNANLLAASDIAITPGNGGNGGAGGASAGGSAANGDGGNGADSGVLSINAGLTSTNGALKVSSASAGAAGAGTTSGTAGIVQDITGSQLALNAANGSITIDGTLSPAPGSSVSLLAGTAPGELLTFTTPQDLALTATGSLSLQGYGFSSANSFSTVDGNIFISSGEGDLVLGSGFSATSSGAGNIVLAAGGNFQNDSGSNAPLLVGTGRFLVYSTRPDNNRNDIGTDPNAISHDFVQYGVAFNAADPMPASLPSGNGFVYSVRPVLTGPTFTVNDQTINYGQTINPTSFSFVNNGSGSYEVNGSAITASAFELPPVASVSAADITLALDPSVGISTAGFADAGSYANGIDGTFATGSVYGVALNGTGKLTVNKINLNVTLSAHNKVYDATTAATVSSSDNRLAGDVLTVVPATATFANKNVGNNKSVSLSGAQLIGPDAGNYNLVVSNLGTLTANITPADLAVNGAVAQNKVYDGTTAATVTGGSITALAGDVVNLNLNSAVFGDKNVGNGKAVRTIYSISGTDAGNYNLVQPTGLAANITARTLDVTLAANNKTYDATTAATGVFGDNRVSGDVLTVGDTGMSFADKNAGTAKPVTATGLSLSGTDAGNYVLASTTASGTADITAANLVVTGAVAHNKVYDATRTASVTGASITALASDIVNLNLNSASFADKNVGTGKAVTATYSISGTDAGNYNLVQPTGLTADITAADLAVNGAVAQNKVYDGSPAATVTGGSITALAGDVVNLNLNSAVFADKNVGTGKAVTATYSISGTDAGNYNLVQPTGLAANITARTLDVTLAANNKTYDATTAATGVFGDNRVSGDVLTVGDTGMSFADKNVGTAKPVTATGLSLSGTDAGNYVLASTTASGTADITAANLVVTGAVAHNKVYDATRTASVTGASITALASDIVNLNLNSASFADKNVGTGKAVTATYSISGTDAGNYNLVQPTGLTADITAADLAVKGAVAQNKVYDGSPAATVTGGSITALAGDVVNLNLNSATFADKNVGTGKAVTATYSISGTDAGNYNLVQPTGLAADIVPAPLTVTANDAEMVFDGTAYSGGNGVMFDGFVPGENKAVLTGSLSYTGSSQGAVLPGTFNIVPTGLTSTNYDVTFVDGTLTIDPLTRATAGAVANNAGGSSSVNGNGSNTSSNGGNSPAGILNGFEVFQVDTSAAQSTASIHPPGGDLFYTSSIGNNQGGRHKGRLFAPSISSASSFGKR